jgi:hypothetical protein
MTPDQSWGNGFAMVPGWLAKMKPSANAILVYVHLAMFGTFNPGSATYDQCRPSKKTLAHGDAKRGYPGTGLSESTVGRALRELEALGAIKGEPAWDDKGGQLPTVYRLVFGGVVQEMPEKPPLSLVTPPPVTGDTGAPATDETPGVSPVTHNQEPFTKNPDTKKKIKTPPTPAPTPAPASATAEAETGGDSTPPADNPAPTGLDLLVAELATAGRWDPDAVREVLLALADRGTDRAEIARVFREVAAGKHGPTGSPRRLLSWWPTTPAAAAPAEPYRHKPAPVCPADCDCWKHQPEPGSGPGVSNRAAAALAAVRAQLPAGKPLWRRDDAPAAADLPSRRLAAEIASQAADGADSAA